jgi:hypothetical protein
MGRFRCGVGCAFGPHHIERVPTKLDDCTTGNWEVT